MLNRLRQHTVAGTTIAVIALGTGGYAYAATTHHTRHHRTRHAANSTGTTRPANPETELTGDTADKAKAAALAAVPGGTVWRASIENPGDPSGAAYEVHVTKSDGSEVEVLEDSSFNVIATNASRQHAGGPGGGAFTPNEDPAHEAGESAQREAEENAGQAPSGA